MDGSFNGYLGYGQGQQPQQPPPQQGLGTFGNLSAQSHHHDSNSHTTLPPLQSQNGGQFGSLSFAHPGSSAHTPTTPHTPSSLSMPQSATSAYSTMSPAHAHAQGNMLPPSSFNHSYGMSQSMAYPSSTVSSMPGTTSATGLPSLRPMPPGGVSGSMGLPSLTSTGQIGQQPSFMQNEETPTHVVGSQGRRGVLPSAPGRPAAPAQGTTTAKSMIPQKDADGKYPCPHCNKTYLHAKHLKRHLLRHTGDRPYMCHLCKDTFSRSDILKRHFQKCSIRRGNPTGANHLAHQRRNTNTGNRLSISQQDGPIGLAGLPDVAHTGAPYSAGIVSSSPTVNGDMSGRPSRANSLSTAGTMSHRNSVAGLGILGSNAPNDQMGTSAGYQPGMPAYAMQQATNGGHMQPNYAFNPPQANGHAYPNPQQMSFLGHPSSRFDHSHNSSPFQHNTNGDSNGGHQTDWSRMFNQGGQDGYIGGQPANASSTGATHIKTEGDAKPSYSNTHHDMNNESFLGSLYSHPGAFGSEYSTNDENGIIGFPNWSMDDPLQAKVDSLTQYCFPSGPDAMAGDPRAEIVRACLTVENIKHFAEHFTSYHGHWPILHMPTFKLTEANNALVMAMMCIGAVYSSKLDVVRVRQMMDFVRTTVVGNSNVYTRAMNGETEGLSSTNWDVEEVQALLMLQTAFMWHGDANQRQAARSEFPVLVRVSKAMGLTQQAGPGHYAYSALHNSHHAQVTSGSFNWRGWLEQEKRNRALYLLFLTDAAMVMFFNTVPQFDPLEVRLMLPADDAAWDGADAHECANALGLNGEHAQARNISGTRRSTQPGMRDAMRTLMEPSATFNPSSTNTYAKFILIHAIIVRIIAVQKTLLLQDGNFQGLTFGLSGSGPATPLSQNDWLEMHHSAPNSGHATPTSGFGTHAFVAAEQEKKRLGNALDKWKRNWDYDIDIQYPPGQAQRRFGFSRDGVHFFYLGRSFFQSTRPADWTLPSDRRFQQVMSLLKRIKNFVLGDNETKGHDIGSVGDIDEQYGLADITLDMKLLFKPHDSLLHTPIAGVRTSL